MNIMQIMPYLEGDEMMFIQGLIKDMSDDQVKQFALIYDKRRKEPQTILLSALLGFFGVAGVHRFLLDQIGMGIVYFLTAGFCFIGTILDLINYKKLSFDFNVQQAQQIAMMIRA